MTEQHHDPAMTIGAFARRSRLSLKALRPYDEMGLLTPRPVDPDNGYRYYVDEQGSRARHEPACDIAFPIA